MTIEATCDQKPADHCPGKAPDRELEPSRTPARGDRRAVGGAGKVGKAGEHRKPKVHQEAHQRGCGGMQHAAPR